MERLKRKRRWGDGVISFLLTVFVAATTVGCGGDTADTQPASGNQDSEDSSSGSSKR